MVVLLDVILLIDQYMIEIGAGISYVGVCHIVSADCGHYYDFHTAGRGRSAACKTETMKTKIN